MRHRIEEPPDSFADGVEAHRNARGLREEDIGQSLHGPDQVVRFPRYLVDLFATLGKPEAATILVLAKLKEDELAALLRLARREADRTVFGKVWSGAWKWALGMALPVYAAAKWGVDQIPIIKEIFGLFRGHGP